MAEVTKNPINRGALRIGNAVVRSAKLFSRGIRSSYSLGRDVVQRSSAKIKSTQKKIDLENKIIAEVIDSQTLKEIEPEASTAIDKALFIPSTAVGDPSAVMRAIISEVEKLGIKINYNSKIVNVNISQQQVQVQNAFCLLRFDCSYHSITSPCTPSQCCSITSVFPTLAGTYC